VPYFTIEDFKAGLDVRRSRFTSVAGTLQKLVNAHITRGGDIEKRKAFVDITPAFNGAALRDLASTKRIAADSGGLIAVGSQGPSAVNLPPGMRYLSLPHPFNAGANLTSIASWTLFGGKLYIAVNYSDGSQYHFYDGTLVYDWGAGVITSNVVNDVGVASVLRDMINAGGVYKASNGGPVVFTNVVTITGPSGVDYVTIGSDANKVGGVDDQELLVSVTGPPVISSPEARAVASFSVTAGVEGVGNQLTQVAVIRAGVTTNLLASPVAFRADPRVTAGDIASAINAGYATHKHNSFAQLGIVFIYAPYGAGDAANGGVLELTSAGQFVMSNGVLTITGGSASPGVNKIDQVRVGGKAVTSGAVDWITSNDQTAINLASNIQAFASVPKIVAAAIGSSVYVSRQVVRSNMASDILTVDTSGDVTVNIVTVETPGDPPGTEPPTGDGGGDGDGDGTGTTTPNPRDREPPMPRIGVPDR
jgi:hypothetical protein